jgi:hypothetical protein
LKWAIACACPHEPWRGAASFRGCLGCLGQSAVPWDPELVIFTSRTAGLSPPPRSACLLGHGKWTLCLQLFRPSCSQTTRCFLPASCIAPVENGGPPFTNASSSSLMRLHSLPPNTYIIYDSESSLHGQSQLASQSVWLSKIKLCLLWKHGREKTSTSAYSPAGMH